VALTLLNPNICAHIVDTHNIESSHYRAFPVKEHAFHCIYKSHLGKKRAARDMKIRRNSAGRAASALSTGAVIKRRRRRDERIGRHLPGNDDGSRDVETINHPSSTSTTTSTYADEDVIVRLSTSVAVQSTRYNARRQFQRRSTPARRQENHQVTYTATVTTVILTARHRRLRRRTTSTLPVKRTVNGYFYGSPA